MRKIGVEIFKYEELSDRAKNRAYNNYVNNFDYPWDSENQASLDKFCFYFDVEIDNMINQRCDFSLNVEEPVLELKGLRLHTYIINNYYDYIHKGRYYSVGHYENGKYQYKSRYSKVIPSRDCVLTGYYMDDEILGKMYKFIDYPTEFDSDITLYDLIEMCLDDYMQSVNDDYESMISEEYFVERVEEEDTDFYENGEIAYYDKEQLIG